MFPDGLTTVPGGNSEFVEFVVSGDSVKTGEKFPEILVGVGGVTVVTTFALFVAKDGNPASVAFSAAWGAFESMGFVINGFGNGGGGLADLFVDSLSERLLLRLEPPRRLWPLFL